MVRRSCRSIADWPNPTKCRENGCKYLEFGVTSGSLDFKGETAAIQNRAQRVSADSNNSLALWPDVLAT